MGETLQTVVAQAPGGFDISFVLVMVGMFAIVYFLMIRPQRKQQQDHQSFLGALKKGDEVYLSSGILGKVFAVEERTITVEIAQNTRVKVLKNSVQGSSAAMLGGAAPKAIDSGADDDAAKDDEEDASKDSDAPKKGGKKKGKKSA
jgi:preprotein translocase subunit YajC